MSDAPTPNDGGSSLTGDAASARNMIDQWRATPGSPYYVGTDRVSADWIQQHDRDLIRGELAGAAGAVGPSFEPDVDLPLSIGHYDLASAPGAQSMTAAMRDVIDTFLPVAFAAHMGQRKVAQAIGWTMTIPNLSAGMFRQLAEASGWSDAHIAVCLSWHRDEGGRRSGSRSIPTPPPRPAATPATPSAIAARKAEIEQLMYIDGKANPAYWSGPLEAEYRSLIAQGG